MSLYGMMRTSVSGMNAQAGRLASISDNVANTGTIGYKRSSVEFRTQVLDVDSKTYQSGSVSTTTRNEISRQGAIRSSSSPTDLAISGDGFFVVQDAGGDNLLTRSGAFFVDNGGNLTNSQGAVLLGYDISETGEPPIANGFGGLERINVGILELTAVPTTEAQLLPNLPADADVVAAGSLPSDNVATSTYAGKTSLLMYDSVGNEQVVDIYFTKTGPEVWEATAYNGANATNGSFPYTTAPLATQTITFDPTTGYVVGGGSTTMNITVPGGVAAAIDLSGISQLGTGYQVIAAETNGSSPGSVDRVEVDSGGRVNVIYNDGNAIPIYQLAIATVPSPDSLRPVPGNNYSVSVESGDVLVGQAELNGNGTIISSALEESNVDLATELTIMIESQRSYTANSRVFQTGSELMDVLINI